MSLRPIHAARARVYQTLRTAHLERAHEFAPAAILFTSRRYDFDERLLAGLEVVQAGRWRSAGILVRSRVRELEVNEPLMLSGARGAALAVSAVRLKAAITGRRALVVCYAIGNEDPRRLPPSRSLRQRLSHRADVALGRAVWRRLDRVAYGSDAARAVYASLMPPRDDLESRVIPALPNPCPCAAGVVRPQRVVFLGAFAERKGFPILLAAWSAVRAELPDATLVLLGTGPLTGLAEAAAAEDPRIELIVDPTREEIHRELAAASVLALPSQPAVGWREQIGLPIVEGLAHGCTVITSTETGLADWLAEAGHGVLQVPTSAGALASALAGALRRPIAPASVLTSLPEVDGRLAADSWLFGGAEPSGAGAETRDVGAEAGDARAAPA
ncbi:glycosyltransferase family 4 protein [Agromyces sp. NPDC058484]|uniref:glycosyltransferase family 4 protein n=1 Tax=Agromyces sp. NPDC058484 TaxID=3346524 RepID=UPI0036522B72